METSDARRPRVADDARVRRFRRLHESGCFLMPNPWDAGSARLLTGLGFEALATTSAGLGYTHALPDTIGAVALDLALANVREITAATPLPVNVDFQDAYAPDLDAVAANVRACIDAGASGLSIEDGTAEAWRPLRELSEAVDRVAAARAAVDGTRSGVVLTARCEAYLLPESERLEVAARRLGAYAEAGADCLFAPGIVDPDGIAALVSAVHPRPLNVLVSSGSTGLTAARLAELGVRRISVGSALARVAWAAFLDAAERIARTGRFESLGSAVSFEELHRRLEP